MAFGGGGNAQYQADFVINTRGAEDSLKRLGVNMTRTLTGVGKSVRADIGQSIREVDRYTKHLSEQLAGMGDPANMSARQQQSHKTLKRNIGELKHARTALSDLSLQGRATTRDLAKLYDTLTDVMTHTGPRGKPRVNRLRQDVGERVKRGLFIETVGQDQGMAALRAQETKARNRDIARMERESAALSRQKEREIAQQVVLMQREEAQLSAHNSRMAAERAKALAANERDIALERRQLEREAAARKRIRDREIAEMQRNAQALERQKQRAFAAGATSGRMVRPGLIGRLQGQKERWVPWTEAQAGGLGSGGVGKGGGGGGNLGGGLHSQPRDPNKVRGQLMPERSREQAKALLYLSSAAQGTMLAMSALQGNIVGVAFGLIFLGYGLVTVAAGFALLAAAYVVTYRFFKMVISQGAKAGAAMEKLGTQMTSYFKDAARAQKNLTQASGLAQNFGIDTETARNVVFDLDKVGMATDTYMTALANASAATGKDIADVTEQFLAIQKAKVKDQANLMEQFSKDFDLGAKRYASSLDLAAALNERFAGAAERNANTQLGMIAKIKAAWTDFTTNVGSVLEGFFKPVLQTMLLFVQAIGAGFAAAKKTGEETGTLQQNMADFASTVRAVTPFLIKLGWILGKVVYHGMILLAKVIKTVADTLIRLWNKIKPVVDTIRGWIPLIKELIDKIISWYQKNKDLIDTLLKILAGVVAFELMTRILMGTLNGAIGLVKGLGDAIVALGKILANTNLGKLIKLGIEGAEAALKTIADIAEAIGKLSGKMLGIGVTAFGDALKGLGGLLDDILNKIKNINNTPIAPRANIPSIPGFGPGMLPHLMIPVDWIATALSQALLLAARHPLVLAALATVAVVIAAGVFPFETGQITKNIIDWTLAILGAIIITFARVHVRLADAFIDLWATALLSGIPRLYELANGFTTRLYEIIVETLKSVGSGFIDIFVGIFTLDFQRAFDGAKTILNALFVNLPTELLALFRDTFMTIITEIIPAVAEAFAKAVKSIFEPIYDLVKEPLSKAWEFVDGWVKEFAAGWIAEKFDTFKNTISASLTGLKDDFKKLFTFEGSDSLEALVKGTINEIKDFIVRISNPFEPMLGWMDPIINKAKELIGWIQKIPGVGGGGSNSGSEPSSGGGTTGSTGNPSQKASTWIKAQIAGMYPLEGGGIRYKIAMSHWSDFQPQHTVVDMFGGGVPDLSKYALGGVVPGRPGTKVPVLADAGEMFLGHPSLAAGSGRQGRAMGGGQSVNVYVDLRGSVIDNEAADRVANATAAKLMGRTSGNRQMTFHRVGG